MNISIKTVIEIVYTYNELQDTTKLLLCDRIRYKKISLCAIKIMAKARSSRKFFLAMKQRLKNQIMRELLLKNAVLHSCPCFLHDSFFHRKLSERRHGPFQGYTLHNFIFCKFAFFACLSCALQWQNIVSFFRQVFITFWISRLLATKAFDELHQQMFDQS